MGCRKFRFFGGLDGSLSNPSGPLPPEDRNPKKGLRVKRGSGLRVLRVLRVFRV